MYYEPINSILIFLALTLILSACGNNEDENTPTNTTEEVSEQPYIDDANAEDTAADTSSTGVYQEEVIEEETR